MEVMQGKEPHKCFSLPYKINFQILISEEKQQDNKFYVNENRNIRQ